VTTIELRAVGLTILAMATPATHACASDTPARLSNSDVKALAYRALKPEAAKLPHLGFELDSERDPRFNYVTVTWAGTPAGSVIVDNFAVDELTGDVWSATSSCLEKVNPDLRVLQSQLRKKLRISPRRYEQLRNSGPLC